MEHARNRLRARVMNTGLRFRTKLTGHTLQAGFNWNRETIHENAREWEMRDSMGYSLPYDPDVLKLIYSLRSKADITSSRFSLYAQDTWRIKAKPGLFNLTYGLRFSYWDWNKEALFSPRVSVGLLPSFSDHWTFRLATGFYYQAPFYIISTRYRHGHRHSTATSSPSVPSTCHWSRLHFPYGKPSLQVYCRSLLQGFIQPHPLHR
ncbi:MAG: TonB-dependent receptor domain-containing protein [Prevotellamassilia sp.]